MRYPSAGVAKYAKRKRRKGVKRGETVTVLPVVQAGLKDKSLMWRPRTATSIKRGGYTGKERGKAKGLDRGLVRREERKEAHDKVNRLAAGMGKHDFSALFDAIDEQYS